MDPIFRRLLSPTGFVLVGLLLLLPFLTLGCEYKDSDGPRITASYTYTGTDLVTGGEGDLRASEVVDGVPTGRTVSRLPGADRDATGEDSLGPEPFAVAAAVLLVVGAGATLLPWVRWRPRVAAAAAFLSGLGLFAAVLRTENRVAEALKPAQREFEETTGAGPGLPHVDIFDHFHLRYGFWLAVVALALLGFGNVLMAVPREKKAEEVPV
jgi:hypothetical protein